MEIIYLVILLLVNLESIRCVVVTKPVLPRALRHLVGLECSRLRYGPTNVFHKLYHTSNNDLSLDVYSECRLYQFQCIVIDV